MDADLLVARTLIETPTAYETALLVPDPLPSQLEVDNRVRLTRGGCRGWHRGLGMRVLNTPARDQLVFSGNYDASCGDNEVFRVVSEPTRETRSVEFAR